MINRIFSVIDSKIGSGGRFFGDTLPFQGKIAFQNKRIATVKSENQNYWVSKIYNIYSNEGWMIGETSEIEDNVTLYHSVTLGGISPSINSGEQRGVKRHPTLKNNVVVGSGAQVLGPVIVGEFAKIGANAVVTRDVPEHAIMVGVPAKNIRTKPEIKDTSFKPYGIIDEDDIPTC